MQRKIKLQEWAWNKTSVDKIQELCQVVDMAFKSKERMTEMPSKDTNQGEDVLTGRTDKIHRALKSILWLVCSDTYTMFKIEHPNQGDGVCDFKWKQWHAANAKRDADAKHDANAKCDIDATTPPLNTKAKTEKQKKGKSNSKQKPKDKKRV